MSIIRLWIQVFMYSLCTWILSALLGTSDLNFNELIESAMPVTHRQYWFFTYYIVLYFAFPFLNYVIMRVKRIIHLSVIIIGIFLLTVLPLFSVHVPGNRLLLFFILYFLGAYIRLYANPFYSNCKRFLLAGVICIVIEVLSIVLLKMYGFADTTFFVEPMTKFPVIVTSLFLFLGFREMKFKDRVYKCIARLSAAAFGVYLLHIGKLHTWIFQALFDDSNTFYSWRLLPQMLFAAICIYAVALLIEELRVTFIEKRLIDFMKVNKRIMKIANKIDQIFNRVQETKIISCK